MANIGAWRKEVLLRRTVSSALVTVVVCLAMILAACTTVGRDFSASKVYDIQIGKTSQTEIRSMFNPPWRVGIEDGRPSWTYAMYHFSAFQEERTKDLVVWFDANNVGIDQRDRVLPGPDFTGLFTSRERISFGGIP